MTASVLLLNASGEPLRVVSLQRALALIFGEKVDTVEAVPDKKLRSPSITLDFPSVLRLRRYVNVPRRKAIWSRRAVFARDNWRCQYCGCSLDRATATIDHIIPKSRCISLAMKSSTWGNTCASCPKCNRRKSSKTPEEAGMKFFFSEFTPKTPRTNYLVFSGEIPKEWRIYIE